MITHRDAVMRRERGERLAHQLTVLTDHRKAGGSSDGPAHPFDRETYPFIRMYVCGTVQVCTGRITHTFLTYARTVTRIVPFDPDSDVIVSGSGSADTVTIPFNRALAKPPHLTSSFQTPPHCVTEQTHTH